MNVVNVVVMALMKVPVIAQEMLKTVPVNVLAVL